MSRARRQVGDVASFGPSGISRIRKVNHNQREETDTPQRRRQMRS